MPIYLPEGCQPGSVDDCCAFCAAACGARMRCTLGFAGNRAPSKIALGHNHACALGQDRTVRCWDHFRPPAYRTDDDSARRAAPLRPEAVQGLTDVVDLKSGWSTCAVRADGSVLCWGVERERPEQVEVIMRSRRTRCPG